MSTPRAPLPEVNKFFEETWRIFRVRVWRLLTIAGVGSVGTFVACIFPVGAGVAVSYIGVLPAAVVWTAVILASLSILFWGMSWVQVAMIECAVAEDADAGMSACYKRGWPKVAAFSAVCILYMALVLGGGFEFVVPGMFLSIALLFAPFIIVAEGGGNIAALKTSLDDTRGYFWPVAMRTGLAGAATSLVGMVPGIGWLLSALTGPFSLVAMAVIYRDLRRARPQPPEPSGRGWLLGASAAGLIIPIVVGIRAFPVLVEKAPQLAEVVKRMSENPQDPEMPQKILAILQGQASTGETITTAAALAQRFSTAVSTAASTPTPPTPPPAQ